MSKLIVMCGIPGSGKTTWARDYREKAKALGVEGVTIVSTDEIREQLWGDAADQKNGNLVFEIAYQRIEFWLKSPSCDTVIFDATNLHRHDRARLVSTFKDIADLELVWVFAPYEECLERNQNRERSVPTDVIRRMYSKMDIPNLAEGFDSYLVVK